MGQFAIPGNFISVLIFGFIIYLNHLNLRNCNPEMPNELFKGKLFINRYLILKIWQ
jgi:hypothetical protein